MFHFKFCEEPSEGRIEECPQGYQWDIKQTADNKLAPEAKGVSSFPATNSDMLTKRNPAIPYEGKYVEQDHRELKDEI